MSRKRNEDSFARKQLAEFLKLPLNGELTFRVGIGEGRKIIQQMRVLLSKLKTKARKLHRTPKEFKMIVKSFSMLQDQEIVVLLKTESGLTSLSDALEELDSEFPGLVGKVAQ